MRGLKSNFAEVGTMLARHWRPFLLIHLLAGVLSFVLLTPVYTAATGALILLSGEAALTDQDILFFFLTPLGFLVMVAGAALFATFAVFESAALFIAAWRLRRGRELRYRDLGRTLLGRLRPLFGLALRMVLRAVLVAAPFLAAAAFVFLRYLTEYDINYYLAERPPIFYQAGAAIAASLLVMAWLLARLLAGWVVALPLLLLGQGGPAEVLERSRAVAAPVRGPLARMLLAWLLFTAALFAFAGLLLDGGVVLAQALAGDSLQRMAWLMAGLLVLWSAASFFIGFVAGAAFVLGILVVFEHLFPELASGAGQAVRPTARVPARLRVRAVSIALAALLVTALGAVVLDRLLARLQPGAPPQVIAHRGASFEAPENTLAAMELAIEEGADWVEIDVQETRSGEIVVIHDSDLMKVAGSPLRVSDAPLEALQAVDIGSRKDPRFSDQRIPTLAELLQRVKGRVKVNIELKYYGHEQRLEESVARIVEAAGMERDVVLMSLSYPGILRMQALRPDWTTGLLASVSVGDLTRLEADFFAINANFANRPFVRAAHRRGRQVLVWTVNDPVLMASVTGRGVDGIITDRPGLAREVLAQYAKLDDHERVLVQIAGLLGREPELTQ
jgi:glycerophosphoryl diester phosphodiesterase